MCFKESKLSYLSEIGVKDSKKLTAKTRSSLAKLIKNSCHSFKVIVVSAKEIDEREEKRITLNKLEELKMAEIIRELKPDSIYIYL
ncbi:unnamed protein product [marine sediment metagenome]|uniref:RNase H type-2 domain-containing protein n=1 Tax=marine sediment metagenome TaxID=412755 RepID=X0YVN0_9ZZZZ